MLYDFIKEGLKLTSKMFYSFMKMRNYKWVYFNLSQTIHIEGKIAGIFLFIQFFFFLKKSINPFQYKNLLLKKWKQLCIWHHDIWHEHIVSLSKITWQNIYLFGCLCGRMISLEYLFWLQKHLYTILDRVHVYVEICSLA